MPIDAIALIRAAKAGRTKDAGGDQPTPAAAASVPNTNIAEVERASAEPQRTMEAPPRKAFALSNRLRFQQRLGESLDKFVCEGVPGVYYIPNYITPEDEKCILDQIYSAEWVQLRNRRLQAIGTQPGPSTVHVKGMVKTIPQWLDQIGSTLQQEGILKQRPNNVLINEYLPGQGILAHEDGPHYEPFVATLSLGAPCVFYFYPHVRTDEIGTKAQGPLQSLVLRPLSLVVFTLDAYTKHLHGIDEVTESVVGARCPCVNVDAAAAKDGQTIQRGRARVSLTFRFVPQRSVVSYPGSL